MFVHYWFALGFIQTTVQELPENCCDGLVMGLVGDEIHCIKNTQHFIISASELIYGRTYESAVRLLKAAKLLYV